MIQLGLRLALSGGRGAIARIALTALAVAVGTAVMLFALSFKPALDDRSTRAAWWDATQVTSDSAAETGLRMHVSTDTAFGQPIIRMLVAPIDDAAPVPPGIPRLPAEGEAFVSPALAARIAALPADQLANRIGTIAGTIGDGALRSPDELVAVIGSDETMLREAGSIPIQRFPTEPRVPELPPILVLIVVLAVAGALAPVIVFVSTATRLSAARREQRLAALRLVGGTPRQVARLAAIEAVVPTVLGALAGLVLFIATRPMVARIPLDGTTWFPASITPPLVPAVILLAAVPIVGVLAAIVTLRRIVVTPLGVQRRQTPPPPGVLRLVPLAVSLVALLGVLGATRGRVADDIVLLVLLGASFAGVVGGIALAGPWLTAIIGHALRRGPGGASTLLAARRLTDDPRGSFGSIAGVIMAVFVASAFFTFSSYARAQAGISPGPLAPGHVIVDLPYGSGAPGDELPGALEDVSGVTAAVPIRTGEIHHADTIDFVALTDCAAVIAQLAPGTRCGDGPIHSVGYEFASDTYRFIPDRPGRDGVRREAPLRIDRASVDQVEGSVMIWNWLPLVLLDADAFPDLAAASGVTRIVVATDGAPATAERIRTLTLAAYPVADVTVGSETATTQPLFAEFERVVHLGLIGTMILAGCSLAVAVTTGMLDRRRQFALLRSAGMPVSRLSTMVMLQAGAPLVAVAAFSGLLGVVVAQSILRLATSDAVPIPDASILVTIGASVLAALSVVALTLPPLDRMTRPDAVRVE